MSIIKNIQHLIYEKRNLWFHNDMEMENIEYFFNPFSRGKVIVVRSQLNFRKFLKIFLKKVWRFCFPSTVLYKGIRKRTHDWTLLRFWTPKVHCTFTVVPKSDPDIGSLLFWKRFWTPKVHCTFTVVPKSGPDIDHLLFWKRFWTPKVHHTFASVPKSGPDSLHLPISWHRMYVWMQADCYEHRFLDPPTQ